MTELKIGTRWRSAVCDTEVVVVRAPSDAAALECGGSEMLPVGTDRDPNRSPDPQWAEGTLIGKRYVLEGTEIEALCTKSGNGSLAIGGTRLGVKSSKPLPSSD
jgi:hypothetical protein